MTAAVVSALGVETGTLLHVAAAVGLPALPASSALTLDMVRHLGAAYLTFLGVQRLLGRDEEPALVAPSGPVRLRRGHLQGVLTNALHPKVAMLL